MSLLNPNRNPSKKQGELSNGAQVQLGRRRKQHGKEGLRVKKLPTAYNQPDGTVHPRVFDLYEAQPSEMTIRLTERHNPNFAKVPNHRFRGSEIHLMAVVSVRRDIDDTPGNYISAMAAVFSPKSVYNYTHVMTEKSTACQFQLSSLIEAMSVAYNNCAALQADNCNRLVIMVDQDMEWIVRVLCRFNEFMDRTGEDEARLHEFLRYPERIKQLVECIEAFEALTRIRVQFWPTTKYELSFGHVFAEQAIEYYLDNYDHEYYGVFDSDDYFDEMDAYSDDDELDSIPEPEQQAVLQDLGPIVVQDDLPYLPADIKQSIEEIEELYVENKLNSQPELKLAGLNTVKIIVADSPVVKKAELLMAASGTNDDLDNLRADEMATVVEAITEQFVQEKGEGKEAFAQEPTLVKQIDRGIDARRQKMAEEIEFTKREINRLQRMQESIRRRMGLNPAQVQPMPQESPTPPPTDYGPLAGLRINMPRLDLGNLPAITFGDLTFGDLQFNALVGGKDGPALVGVDVSQASRN